MTTATETAGGHLVLVEELRRWAEEIVTGELNRLTRRAPRLTGAEVAAIRQALEGLVEIGVLSPSRAAPTRTAELRALFGLGGPVGVRDREPLWRRRS